MGFLRDNVGMPGMMDRIFSSSNESAVRGVSHGSHTLGDDFLPTWSVV